MEWVHKCKLEWLQDRQRFLTATDVKDLLPITKTGRARKLTAENYWKIYANKLVRLNEESCYSSGAAARGHLMEPYAIEEFNSINKDCQLKHWDDICIAKDRSNLFGLAYSPDALDIEPTTDVNVEPTVLGEVKSYSTEKHVVSLVTDKMQLEERWQIATAMYCSPTIKDAYLIFYSPLLKEMNIGIKHYTRDDLQTELTMVEEVESNWLEFVDNLETQVADVDKQTIYTSSHTEEEIAEIVSEHNRLNP